MIFALLKPAGRKSSRRMMRRTLMRRKKRAEGTEKKDIRDRVSGINLGGSRVRLKMAAAMSSEHA